MADRKYVVSRCSVLIVFALASAGAALAESAPLPSYLVIAAPAKITGDLMQLDYSEAEFTLPDKDPVLQKGKFWHFGITFPESMAELEPEKAWAQIRPALLATGWTMLHDTAGQGRTARYQKNGRDAWLDIFVSGATDIRATLIETGASPMKLTLQKPAAKPETNRCKQGELSVPGSSCGRHVWGKRA